MKEIIPVQVRNDRQLVSARELHKALDYKSRFSRWVEQNFTQFDEGIDFMSVQSCTNMPNGGVKPIQDYLLTIDMAKELCMMSYTEKGKEIRQYFIQVEKAYKSQKNLQNMDSYMIEDPIKRAERWIEEQEAYQEKKQLAEKQAKQLEEQKDDVLFAHVMTATNHSEKIKELAADLTKMGFIIGQNQLFKLLRLVHYISKYSTMPIGQKIKCGYFVIKHGVKNGHAYSQTLVTPKGQKQIINKCLRGRWDKEYQQVM